MPKSERIPWWAETQWWESSDYAGQLNCSPEELRIAVECMKAHFDRGWWEAVFSAAAPPGNPVAGWLIGKGLWPLQFIYTLGTSLHRLRECIGVPAKIRDLKQGAKASSVLFEIETAASFAEHGLAVRFPAETDARSPDIVVTTSDGEVAVECKRLEEQATDKWTSELLGLVMLHSDRFGLAIELAPDLSFLRKSRPENWNGAIARALANEIQAAVSAALNASPPPERVSVPGVAEIRLFEGMAGQGSVSGGPLSPAADMRRLIEHAWDASCQCPQGMPGVLVMQCRVPPGRSLAQAALRAAVEAAPPDACADRIAALAIMPAIAVGPLGNPVFVKTDRFANSPAVAAVLAALARPRCAPVWPTDRVGPNGT